jgi:hypothetical protein
MDMEIFSYLCIKIYKFADKKAALLAADSKGG